MPVAAPRPDSLKYVHQVMGPGIGRWIGQVSETKSVATSLRDAAQVKINQINVILCNTFTYSSEYAFAMVRHSLMFGS